MIAVLNASKLIWLQNWSIICTWQVFHVWREIFGKIYYSDLQCHENTIGKGFGEMQYVIHVQYVVDNLTRILSTGRVLKVISVNSYSVG